MFANVIFVENQNRELIHDVFRIRYSIDSELEMKHLKQLENDILDDFDVLLERETQKIHYRSLEYIEDLFENILRQYDDQLRELKRKHSKEFIKWIIGQRKALIELVKKTKNDFQRITEFLANLDNKLSESDTKHILLYGEIVRQLTSTFEIISEALIREQYSRKTLQVSKIIRAFNGISLLLFRLIEIQRHWEDKKKRLILYDLTQWDLDTVKHLLCSLKVFESRTPHTDGIDPELISILWGDE